MTWEARPRHIKVAREVLEKCLFFFLRSLVRNYRPGTPKMMELTFQLCFCCFSSNVFSFFTILYLKNGILLGNNTFHQGVLGWLSLGKWFRKNMLAGHEIFAWVQPLFALFQSILVLCWSLVCSYNSINISSFAGWIPSFLVSFTLWLDTYSYGTWMNMGHFQMIRH